jgi:preprotein translocase subunit YajC
LLRKTPLWRAIRKIRSGPLPARCPPAARPFPAGARGAARSRRALPSDTPKARFPAKSAGRRSPRIEEAKMFATPAFAQTAGGGTEAFMSFVPLILIFVIMYFLLIRPQQKRAKEHKAMVEALRRGDQVLTQGGIIGKVSKVKEDGEIEVEIAEGVRVRVMRATIAQVMSKSEPAAS